MKHENLPRLIALCGRPTSGKTTAAEIIQSWGQHEISDDGAQLREIAIEQFGLTHAQVHTQEGKLEQFDMAGAPMVVRDLLGRIGKGFEAEVHRFTLPFLAWKAQDPSKSYVMGSVRRDQGEFWASKGALVLEIDRPGIPESPYDFDQYVMENVHATVKNNGLELGYTDEDAKALLSERLLSVIHGLYLMTQAA